MRSDGMLYSVSYFTDDLWQLDPTTGAGTRIGPLGFDVDIASGLTFDACGTLWLASGGALYEVDPETASSTEIFDSGEDIVALTSKGERLLALVKVGTPRQLAWIDPREGTLELFGEQVFLPTFQVGLDFDQDGDLWAMYWMESFIPSPWISSIVKYEPVTGEVSSIVEVGPPVAGNLAITPPQGRCGRAVVEIPTSSPVALAMLAVLLTAAGLFLVGRTRQT